MTTKEKPVDTTENETTANIKMVEIDFGGTKMQIPEDSRQYKSLMVLKEEQDAKAFQVVRDEFCVSVVTPVSKLMVDYDDALDGMTLIWNFNEDETPKLIESKKITVAIRGPRQSKD